MGFFDVFTKKKRKQSSVLIAMPMFNGDDSYSLDAVIHDLKAYWHLNVTKVSGDNELASFFINGQMAALTKMPIPIPSEDIESTAQYTYLWNKVGEECENHTSHAIITVMPDPAVSIVEGYKLLTMLNASVLRTSQSIGIYQGTQTLLLPKDLYVDFADFLLEDQLPVQLWIYIGLVGNQQKNSMYTYGLKEFGKPEIEILDSTMDRSELYDFLSPILAYILEGDVYLKDGETIGFTEEQKIKITQSKGKFVEGNTLKLEI